MIVHAALRFSVVECGERGLINVNGVGVQQVHELGSCIVRTTAILDDNKSRAIAKMAKIKENCHDQRRIPSGHFVEHLTCGGSSTVERHRRSTSLRGDGVSGEEGGFLLVGTFLRITPAVLPAFSAAGRDRAAALVPGARALAGGGAAGALPCMTTLPYRLRAGED